MDKVQNFNNVIAYLEKNEYGYYPPSESTVEMYYYFKEIHLNFSMCKLDSGFYRFKMKREE
jgi:hypothetical protein